MSQAKTLQSLAEKSTRFMSVKPTTETVTTLPPTTASHSSVHKSTTLDDLRKNAAAATTSVFVRSLVIVNGIFIVFKVNRTQSGIVLSLPGTTPRSHETAEDAAKRVFVSLDCPYSLSSSKEILIELGRSKTSVCMFDLQSVDASGPKTVVNRLKMDGRTLVSADGYILFPYKRLIEISKKRALEKSFILYEERGAEDLSGSATFAPHDQSVLIRLRNAEVL